MTDGKLLQPVQVPSLSEVAYESIRESILTGRLEMGARLLDTRLADDLGVSRGTVREAISRLADDGLVTGTPRQGVFVREFGAQDVIDLYNVRIGIEPVAARLCVRRRADLAPLDAVLDAMRHGAGAADVASVNEADSAFHTQMVELSGNEHLLDLYRAVRGRLRMALLIDNRGNEDFDKLVERHVPLLEALRSGDERRAGDAAHEHIVGHVDEVLRRLGADPAQLLQPR